MTKNALLMQSEVIENKIFLVRGKKVMFRLSKEEGASLRFQIGISKTEGRGGRRSLPYAFTENGVATADIHRLHR